MLQAFRRQYGRLSLSKNLRFSDSFPALLVPRKLETAQNRKVRAARAKPVLPAIYNIIGFIDSPSLPPAVREAFSMKPFCRFGLVRNGRRGI